MQTNSFILASFAYDSSAESDIAGALAFAPNDKKLLYENRDIKDEMIYHLDIFPKKSTRRWGGFESRIDFLESNIKSYKAKKMHQPPLK